MEFGRTTILSASPTSKERTFRRAIYARYAAHERATAAQVRARTSTAKTVGAASATRWASLRRWTRSALGLFGVAPGEDGTLRERAAKVATFVAARAPIALGPVPLDAFFGASFCRSP